MNKRKSMFILCDLELNNFLLTNSSEYSNKFSFPTTSFIEEDLNLKNTAIRSSKETLPLSPGVVVDKRVNLLGYYILDHENDYTEIYYYRAPLSLFYYLDKGMNLKGQAIKLVSTTELLDTSICLHNYKDILKLLSNTLL